MPNGYAKRHAEGTRFRVRHRATDATDKAADTATDTVGGPAAGSRRPRALFISADVPWPPDGGGRIATLNNLRAFSRLYETDLVALADPLGPLDTAELEHLCRRVVVIPHPFTFRRHRIRQAWEAFRSLWSTQPYRLRKFRSARLASVLAALRAENDYAVVHFDQFGVVQYPMPDVPTSYSCHNVESDIYRLGATVSGNPLIRLWSWQEGAKLRRSERKLLGQFDVVFTLAGEDALLLEKAGLRSLHVVPMPSPPLRHVQEPPREPVLLSLGTMSWFGVDEGLLWFHSEVYPLVREKVPGVRWNLAGPNAGPAIRRLNGTDGITVLGYVDDLRPTLESARAAVIPLRIAGGIRMKLLDLMAAGVPSVATVLGARGLGFDDGAGCFRRNDPREFADALVALLTDDELWMRTVRLGQGFLADRHTEGRLDAELTQALAMAAEHHACAARDRA